ncbi:MAG: hypothetical protein KDE19_10860 [Caldilineaceae bacterium]|nr:hypothetical protein [Caldilineaceae bacterium]
MEPEDDKQNDEEILQYHRAAGLALTPVMQQLGYETEVEIDISMKSQLIDIICVRREKVVQPTLPPIYWEVFGVLNEHNLFSFKSYSESFNGQSLEEFYGHLTNYCKVRGVKREAVNLYVLTSHFPQKLLTPLLETGQAVATQGNTVYDITISTLRPVRFIICSRTDNPVLALFSDKVERIVAAYTTIQNEPQLFDDISIYWKQILRKIDQEIKNMYTREDFLRDYPDTNREPGLFEWLEELGQKKLAQGIEQGKLAMYNTLMEILAHRLGEVPPAVDGRLRACTLAQLDTLVNPALDAATWDEFVVHLPEQTT